MGLRFKFIFMISMLTLGMMAVAVAAIRMVQEDVLSREITERGVTIARALAATCIEPMQLPERTLAVMMVIKDVVQESESEEARRDLYGTAGFGALLLAELATFGGGGVAAAVRNEGVLFARVVGPDGKTIALADAVKKQEEWLDEIDKPYQPPLGTAQAASGTVETVGESSDGSMFVIAVPILKRGSEAAGAAAGGPPEGGEAGKAGAAPGSTSFTDSAASLGTVYLGMSAGLIRRAIARAVARVVQIAVGVLVFGIIVAIFIAAQFVRPVYTLRDAVKAVAGGDFNVRVNIRRGDEIGALATAFNEMTEGLAEKELIGSAFGAYVSKDVLDEILKNPDAMKVGGSRKSVTMVCSDVRGFTAMSERLQPEEVVSVINLYLDAEAKLVNEHHGYLDRFVGDAVRAVFGIPVFHPDDAVRAVRCALAIKEAVSRIVDERAAKGLPAPKVGIGLDSGPVIAGNLGAPGIKLDYTVVGDPVGIAENLVDQARDPNARGAQIVLSERTLALVKDLVEVRELDPLTLKGRTEPIRIYDLVRLKA